MTQKKKNYTKIRKAGRDLTLVLGGWRAGVLLAGWSLVVEPPQPPDGCWRGPAFGAVPGLVSGTAKAWRRVIRGYQGRSLLFLHFLYVDVDYKGPAHVKEEAESLQRWPIQNSNTNPALQNPHAQISTLASVLYLTRLSVYIAALARVQSAIKSRLALGHDIAVCSFIQRQTPASLSPKNRFLPKRLKIRYKSACIITLNPKSVSLLSQQPRSSTLIRSTLPGLCRPPEQS